MATHRVAPVNLGAGDGTSWQDAIELQTLFNNPPPGVSIQSGDELWLLGENNIWNVGGRYQLTATLSINILKIGVYGGFRGTETSGAQRNALIACNNPAFPDYFVYPSILIGGFNQNVQFPVVSFINTNDCVLDGVIIEQGLNTAQGATGGGMLVANANNITIENVVLRQNWGWTGGGLYLGSATTNVYVRNCVVENNIAQDNFGGGLSLQSCQGVELDNVLFFGNRMLLPLGTYARGGGAIYVGNNSQLKCFNLTMADNFIQNLPATITNPGLGVYCDNSFAEFFNSIFYPDDIAASATGNLFFGNCLLGQTAASLPPTAIMNNCLPFGTNPRFVSPGAPAWNYHLWTIPLFPLQSPCINPATGTINPPMSIDLEGKPRFMGLMVDMGAFEYNV